MWKTIVLFSFFLLLCPLLSVAGPSHYVVQMSTTKGVMLLNITRGYSPKGADRFYELVTSGFYDNSPIFRVIPGFVAQFGIAGDPKVDSKWRNSRIDDDPVKKSNKEGWLSYATSGPNRRSTQVFINLNDNSALDAKGFSPFGKVIQGLDVASKFDSSCKTTLNQEDLHVKGGAFIKSVCPKMDFITKMKVVDSAILPPNDNGSNPPKKEGKANKHNDGNNNTKYYAFFAFTALFIIALVALGIIVTMAIFVVMKRRKSRGTTPNKPKTAATNDQYFSVEDEDEWDNSVANEVELQSPTEDDI